MSKPKPHQLSFDTTLDLGQFGEHEVHVVGTFSPQEPDDATTPGCPSSFEAESVKFLKPVEPASPFQLRLFDRYKETNFLFLCTCETDEGFLELARRTDSGSWPC